MNAWITQMKTSVTGLYGVSTPCSTHLISKPKGQDCYTFPRRSAIEIYDDTDRLYNRMDRTGDFFLGHCDNTRIFHHS